MAWTEIIGCFFSLFIFYRVFKMILGLKKVKNFTEKPVLITGCDSGLGFDLAVALCKFNIPVFATCLTENGKELLNQAVEALAGKEQFRTFIMDVRNSEDCSRVVEIVRNTVGNDVTSQLGSFAGPSLGPYCVSKFALEGYANVVRHEYRMMGVSVHVLSPGFFATNLTTNDRIYRDRIEEAWNKASKEARNYYGERYKERLKETFAEGLSMMARHGTAHVVDACVHALTSIYPKSRYPLGLDGHFFSIFSLFPVVLQDLFMDLYFSLSGSPVPRYLIEEAQNYKLGILDSRRFKIQEETWQRKLEEGIMRKNG